MEHAPNRVKGEITQQLATARLCDQNQFESASHFRLCTLGAEKTNHLCRRRALSLCCAIQLYPALQLLVMRGSGMK